MSDPLIEQHEPFFTLETPEPSGERSREQSQGRARAGRITTAHGVIPTPIFMPVGTQGTIKALEIRAVEELDAKIILGNTYHLYLRPGNDVLQHAGGLHKFMRWNRPILTDSGGFQVFSLRDLRKLNANGVEFKSHIDGSRHMFTPENVVDTQRTIGSDIFMVLDECTAHPATHQEARSSMHLTLDWAERSRKHHLETAFHYGFKQAQFGIGQGSVYPDLRRECLNQLIDMDFEGYAIGGLAVGEPAETMYDVIDVSTEIMPVHKPRYLMGVGTPENILRAIDMGIDMFDCVMPTRNARNGTIFTTLGKTNVKNAKWRMSNEPIDPGLDVWTSQNFTMAYLRHLFVAKEITGLTIATMQNLALYLWLTRTAREKIIEGTFRQWSAETIERLNKPRD